MPMLSRTPGTRRGVISRSVTCTLSSRTFKPSSAAKPEWQAPAGGAGARNRALAHRFFTGVDLGTIEHGPNGTGSGVWPGSAGQPTPPAVNPDAGGVIPLTPVDSSH